MEIRASDKRVAYPNPVQVERPKIIYRIWIAVFLWTSSPRLHAVCQVPVIELWALAEP